MGSIVGAATSTCQPSSRRRNIGTNTSMSSKLSAVRMTARLPFALAMPHTNRGALFGPGTAAAGRRSRPAGPLALLGPSVLRQHVAGVRRGQELGEPALPGRGALGAGEPPAAGLLVRRRRRAEPGPRLAVRLEAPRLLRPQARQPLLLIGGARRAVGPPRPEGGLAGPGHAALGQAP